VSRICSLLNVDQPEEPETPVSSIIRAPDETLQFCDVINELQTVYPKQAMADISTSFCFICVLHLANEKGLVISNNDKFLDLTIQKDHTAEFVSGGE
jgi:condensin complex subunit 2